MGNLTTALMFVMVLNVLMMITQASVLNLNPEGSEFYHCQDTMLETIDKNKCIGTPEIDNTAVSSQFPSGEGSVSPTSGNIFIDIFSSIKNWFMDTFGVSYLKALLLAPYNLLKMIVPQEVAFGIGAIWYAITFLLIIAFMWGRDV